MAHAGQEDVLAEDRPARRRFAFDPGPAAKCEYFLITEFSANVAARTTQDPVDSFNFTDSFGLMKNFDERSAVGGSIDVHLAKGVIKVAPTVRYKRWLGGRQSIDVSLGYIPDNSDGLIGPMANARYSPVTYFHVQAGVCQDRDRWTTYDIQTNSLQFHDRKQFRVYGGVGFGGVPGIVLWGAQAVGAVVVGSLVAAMN